MPLRDDDRFEGAVRRFQAIHREDPGHPRALDYHRRVAGWVRRLDSAAAEEVMLASWSQHLKRWEIPRETFPEGVAGYKQWRSRLAFFHADQAAEVLTQAGYDGEAVARVRDLLVKKRLRSDADTQLLEDAVCLAFLQAELVEFAAKHDDEKVVAILRKTWAKMGERGRRAALELAPSLPAPSRQLIEQALEGPGTAD